MTEPISVFPPQHREEFLAAYQSVLDLWPVPYQEKFVATRFGETHVIVSGPEDAPPIIFLHALFATAAVWYPNAGPLSQHYRTYAVDMIGEANPSRPARSIKTMDEMLQWFTDLLDGLGIQQTFLVGNSFGAFLSASFAMQLPERIRGMVLIGPAATFKSITPFYIHMFIPVMLALLFPKIPALARGVHNSLEWMRNGLPVDPAWGKLFLFCMLHGGMSNQLSPKVYKPEELGKIKTPTLLLIGDRERIYKPEETIRIAKKAVPGLCAEIIPNAHHITALAQPEIVNQRIELFFSNIHA